jgi:hypothetical protein
MPAKLLSFVHRNAPSAATAKNLFKNVASKAITPSPLLLQAENRDPETMDLLKRHSISLNLTKHSKDQRNKNTTPEPPPPATLQIVTESPPLISFNPEIESSGALFSGQLLIKVTEKSVAFKTIQVQLFCVTSVKKPVVKDCEDCHSATKELKKWTFAKEPLTLPKGDHKFPVSFLFNGKMPATTHSQLCMLDYHWLAQATTADGKAMTFSETLKLQRAIHPGQDKNSIRVFPPTDITTHLTHNPIIYETGDIPIAMRLTGVAKKTDKMHLRWRLRRLVWRIEEVEKVVSHPCDKHHEKVPDSGIGLSHDFTRVIGEDEVNYQKTPWKTDIAKGEIDAEFVIKLSNKLKRPVCLDVNATDYGMSLTHHLVIELVVVEEQAPLKRPTQAVPTGSARILRAQFPLILTARAGLGISWDEETPPVYQDVPPSPPSYRNDTTECAPFVELDELDDDFEQLSLGESLASAPPEFFEPPRSGSITRTGRSPAPRMSLVGMSPRLVAAAMSPRLQAQVTRERERSSSSRAAPSPAMRPTSSSGLAAGNGRGIRLSADDLLQEPPEYRLNRTEEENEEPDVASGVAL